MTHLTLLVLNAIADDYEDLEIILVDAGKWAERDRIDFTEGGVRESLVELIQAGLARAYEYSQAAQRFEVVPIASGPQVKEDHWFLITAEGKKLLQEPISG
ncbi:MAG: hypothetical protein ABI972_02720 [Acidobacteriota bacterium]